MSCRTDASAVFSLRPCPKPQRIERPSRRWASCAMTTGSPSSRSRVPRVRGRDTPLHILPHQTDRWEDCSMKGDEGRSSTGERPASRRFSHVHRPRSNCALLAGVGGMPRRNWSTILRRCATNMIYTAEPPVPWTAVPVANPAARDSLRSDRNRLRLGTVAVQAIASCGPTPSGASPQGAQTVGPALIRSVRRDLEWRS